MPKTGYSLMYSSGKTSLLPLPFTNKRKIVLILIKWVAQSSVIFEAYTYLEMSEGWLRSSDKFVS